MFFKGIKRECWDEIGWLSSSEAAPSEASSEAAIFIFHYEDIY